MEENKDKEENEEYEEYKPSYYPFYRSFFESFKLESFENVGKIAMALGEKVFNDQEPQLDNHLMSIYFLIEPSVLKTVDKLKNNSKAGKKGGAPKGNKFAAKQTHSNTKLTNSNIKLTQNYQKQGIEIEIAREKEREKDKEIDINNSSESSSISEKKEPFQKPTIEEITGYCLERHNSVNPEKFYNHYESNGWKVGRTPMKDWKAAIRTWEKSEYTNTKENKVSYNSFMQNQYSDEDFKKLEEEFRAN